MLGDGDGHVVQGGSFSNQLGVGAGKEGICGETGLGVGGWGLIRGNNRVVLLRSSRTRDLGVGADKW